MKDIIKLRLKNCMNLRYIAILPREYAVGYMYFYGKGIVLDIDMAQYWMRRAAEHGYPEAPAALAKIDRIVAMQRQPFSLPVPQLKLKALENNVNSYPNSQPGFEYETARP